MIVVHQHLLMMMRHHSYIITITIIIYRHHSNMYIQQQQHRTLKAHISAHAHTSTCKTRKFNERYHKGLIWMDTHFTGCQKDGLPVLHSQQTHSIAMTRCAVLSAMYKYEITHQRHGGQNRRGKLAIVVETRHQWESRASPD